MKSIMGTLRLCSMKAGPGFCIKFVPLWHIELFGAYYVESDCGVHVHIGQRRLNPEPGTLCKAPRDGMGLNLRSCFLLLPIVGILIAEVFRVLWSFSILNPINPKP